MSERGTRRVGMAGYAALLRKIIDKPDTTNGLIARTGFGHTMIRRVVPSLHALRVIHIKAWKFATKAPPQPVFAFGDDPDAAPPLHRPNGRPIQAVRTAFVKRHPVELVAFVSLVRALAIESEQAEILAVTGLSWNCVTAAIAAMRRLRLVRIRSWRWREQGGAPIPSYQWALAGSDAPRPEPAGRAAVNRRYREARAAREAQQFINRALVSSASHQEEACA